MIRSVIDPASMALLLIVWPLVLNLLTVIKAKSRATFYSLSTLSTAGMASAAFLYGPVDTPVLIGDWVAFNLDESSWIFVILIYACWCVTSVYSMGYVSAHFPPKAGEFHKYMNATLCLSIGAGMADSFFTLFFFYTASVFTVVPLLTLRGTAPAFRAATFYVHSTLWPVLLVALPAVACNFPMGLPFERVNVQQLGWGHGKSSAILALIVVGFSKNCVAPFHLWLPRTSVAAAPVTAMIHSVASVQVGGIALFKIARHVYGVELLGDLCDHFFETGWLLYLCGFTSVYTAYRAWKATDLKERFSFSTVGQLSYVLTAILIGTRQGLEGAMLHIVTHSVAKLNLFFCAGAYLTSFGSVQAPQVAAAIPGKRWLGLAAVLSGLSISGFPFLMGFYSKDVMLLEELRRRHYSAAAFLLIGSVLNFVYIYPLVRASLRRSTPATPRPAPLPLAMRLAILVCTGSIVICSACAYWLTTYVEV